MIKSMTGFGRAIFKNSKEEIIVELKSVNHRFLEINFKSSEVEHKFESSNFIKWDWLSKDGLNLEAKDIDTVIFFPKPSSMDEIGYINGFINSSENIYREFCNLKINKFISISSTRVYDKQDNQMSYESEEISTEEFRGKIIRE